MRCEEVIRQMAAPSDGQETATAAIAEHLKSCPACAEWSARMASFDRLWALTRPTEPTPEQWDAVWAGLERSLDSSTARGLESANSAAPSRRSSLRIGPGTLSSDNGAIPQPFAVQRGTAPGRSVAFGPRTRREYLMLACAAVLLFLVAGVDLLNPTPRFDTPKPNHSDTIAQVEIPEGSLISTPADSINSVDIEEGELVVIRSSTENSLSPGIVRYEPDDGIDSWYVMFNAIESMANPVVAVR